MTQMIHVFAIDPPGALLEGPTLSRSLGVDAIDRARVEVTDPTALTGVGLSGYLVDGHGADATAVLPDEAMLDALSDPVLIVLPGAVQDSQQLTASPPLRLLGRYAVAGAKPAGPPLRTPSAEGILTGAPPIDAKKRDRKASSMVAMVALAVALLIALVMVLVGS